MYRLLLLASAAVAVAWGADPATLGLVIRAQTDFDRVNGEAFATVQDTTRCSQSQAELLPVTPPTEVALLRFRKGYCEILGARLSGNRADYRQAAQDFGMAMAAWPARTTEPMSSGLEVLSAVARLEAGADIGEVKPGLDDAVRRGACPASVMSPRICQDLLRTGRLWQGWIALHQKDWAGASAAFREFPELPWASWAAGRQAEEERRYPAAVDALAKTVETWNLDQRYPRPGLIRILGPGPEVAEATVELGAAQYLAGDFSAAIATLDGAIRAQPGAARAIFIRGLARYASGQGEAALTDFQSASRAAFANADDRSSAGQAHLFRGVWHFRRKAWSQAEGEFASALNADPGPELRNDAKAWRLFSAVAGGSCGPAGEDLRGALGAVSGFFPRAESEQALAACAEQPRNISQN